MYLAEDLVHPSDSAQVAWSRFKEMLAADPGTAMQQLGREALQFGLKVLLALVLYFVGAWVIKRIKHAMERYFQRKKTDRAMASFISSFVSIALTVLLIVVLVGTLGINTTSLAALLAAGGMALGMALSGTVQNFAGGLMLMIFKPFKAGDYIEAQGYAGVVTEVTIVGTHLTTIDNRRVVLPNGALSIGTNAFDGCSALSEITLPAACTQLPDFTFRDCRSLKRIVIPEGVAEIGESAFSGCKSLEEAVLPSTLRKIGCRAFSECQSLASIALPEGLEEIGDEAFYLCKSLTQADIPSSVTKIGEDVFAFSGVR